MRNLPMSFLPLAGVCLSVTLAASTSMAAVVEITVTSQTPAGGFSFTPIWLGIHDGTFDTFDSGNAASAAVEAVAELGDTGPITTAFTGEGPQTTLLSPVGAFTPGQSASTTLNVADPTTRRYLSFLSMIVPSNDLFIGNGDPLGIELFDGAGTFTGPLTITILGSNVWDAGTEVNDAGDGPAFVMGVDATAGTDENGMIALFLPDVGSYLDTILGLTTAAGYDISELFGAADVIATIEIQEVPEPSSLVLAGIGIALALIVPRRRRAR